MDVRGYVPVRTDQGLIVIWPTHRQSLGAGMWRMGLTSATSQNWIAANVGVFIPFWVPKAVTVTKMFWVNGTAVAGNIDVGIFEEDGTRIVSAGSTAQAGTSQSQIVDITDTTLDRGRYYMGMTSDTSGVTQKITANLPSAGVCQGLGIVKDTSCAPPLSTSANPATFVAYDLAFIPALGLQCYRTFGP